LGGYGIREIDDYGEGDYVEITIFEMCDLIDVMFICENFIIVRKRRRSKSK
jgi:hypothetical protein